ncbi:MAG: gluconate 2-dehydrogenase subunit 3 family protein [Balneolaceae bacterium]
MADKMSRREAIKAITLTTVGGGLFIKACSPDGEEHVHRLPGEEALLGWQKKFFTDHEFDTVKQLANMVIPADERSGNAEVANVHNFIDYMLAEEHPWNQTRMRGGLKWLDVECSKRFDQTFIDCDENQKKRVLDDIAWPEAAKPEMSQGVRFFNMFRDYTASGFWSSKMGVKDIGYIGNMATHWDGPPKDVLEHIGISVEN